MGVARLYADGTFETHTVKHEADLSARERGVAGVIKRHAEPACLGVCIEDAVLRAILQREGPPADVGRYCAPVRRERPALLHHPLTKLKVHATGKGNAKKPEMQAAARARWEKDLSEDEADAAWATAYAMNSNLFV
ncbi:MULTISPECIES: hypothetical protein [unclassified Mesorhizobium]|uniref:hypothetical protein n=1 Tax=unclassified Mesorhizobium TaxID=325217 RepID=UPI003334C619